MLLGNILGVGDLVRSGGCSRGLSKILLETLTLPLLSPCSFNESSIFPSWIPRNHLTHTPQGTQGLPFLLRESRCAGRLALRASLSQAPSFAPICASPSRGQECTMQSIPLWLGTTKGDQRAQINPHGGRLKHRIDRYLCAV